jgi:hypothetical protein
VTQPPQEALPFIHLALKSCKIDPNGWYNLADFGTAAPGAGVAPKLYGLAKMGELLDATRHFTRDGQRFRPTPMLTIVPGSQ